MMKTGHRVDCKDAIVYSDYPDKPHRERLHICLWAELQAVIDVDWIEKSERPDFLVYSTSGRLVGLEHTNAYVPPGSARHSRKEIEMAQRSVLRKTLLLLESAGVPPVDGKVQFADGPVINEDELARALAGAIEAAVYSGAAHPTVIRKPAVPGVSRIHLSNGNVRGTQVLSHSRLSSLDIPTVVPESRGIIQEIIDSKSELAMKYERRSRLDEMWLLIAVDESVGSGGLNFSTSDSRGGYDLGVFHRAFFLKSVGKELYELCA